jgi:hypothetical protein
MSACACILLYMCPHTSTFFFSFSPLAELRPEGRARERAHLSPRIRAQHVAARLWGADARAVPRLEARRVRRQVPSSRLILCIIYMCPHTAISLLRLWGADARAVHCLKARRVRRQVPSSRLILCIIYVILYIIYMCPHTAISVLYTCVHLLRCPCIIYVCPHPTMCVCPHTARNMCPHTAMHMQASSSRASSPETSASYCYTCVLILLYMCPHTTICVSSYYYMCPLTCVRILLLCMSSYYYMCPHATIYASSHYYICVLRLLYVSSYCYICPHTTKYVSSYHYTYVSSYLQQAGGLVRSIEV